MKSLLPFSRSRSPQPRTARQNCRRYGALIVWLALFLVFALSLCALSVDTGYMYLCRTELQRSVDAGAFAGAAELMDGSANVQPAVMDMMAKNLVGGRAVTPSEVQAVKGKWDDKTRTFVPTGESPNAVRVSAHLGNRPLFFGAILGEDTFSVESQAIAVFQPRDVVVVLDYSASMNDDSELKQIDQLGRATIEANLLQIYQELGSPRFGNMVWQPPIHQLHQQDHDQEYPRDQEQTLPVPVRVLGRLH